METTNQEEPLRVSIVSLGCAKNLVDTEKMLGVLGLEGFALVGAGEPAEVMIVNTCGFIEDARQEAFENIQDAVDAKQEGTVNYVVVTGCLAQSWGAKLLDQIPGIDAVVGLGERDQIAKIIKELLGANGEALYLAEGEFRAVADDTARLRVTDRSWSYLRISEGCDQGCTFCTIPAIRGPFRSKPLDAIIAEAKELVADGAVELNLIGQETSGYGLDIGYQDGLAGLLGELNKIDGLEWIRILYMHPASINDRLIEAIGTCEKVVPYIDIPLQHISDRILRLMNRKIDRIQTENLLHRLVKNVPDLTIRTTMLVGFPSETAEEFSELLDFIQYFRFDALGGFSYSFEADTPSAKIGDDVPEEIRNERLDKLMAVQQTIAFESADKYIDCDIPCLVIAEASPDDIEALELDPERLWLVGRHWGQAPEVDSVTYLTTDDEIELGQIVIAHIEERVGYDLIGEF